MTLFLIFVCLTAIGLIAYGFQILSIRSKLKATNIKIKEARQFLTSSESFCPPVSIIKPLKGLDDNLFDNLESFCLQDYPEYEIIFSLQDCNDPAYKVARKVKEKHPDKDISVITERCNIGLNPKVNNLIPAYKIAKYEHILISDSNVLVSSNYLKEITKHMKDPSVGLVSNMIHGTSERTFGSILENLHLNSFIIGSVCLLDKYLRMPCVIGKSMLMRKKDLEFIGGLKAVKDVLAEDYIIGKRIHEMGKKVILSTHLIRNVNEYWGIKKFINRHTRWGKLRWKIGGISYISELIGNPVFMSFLPLILLEVSKITLFFAMFVSFVKILGDIYIGKLIQKQNKTTQLIKQKITDSDALTFNPFRYFLSPLKDIIIGIIWFIPLVSNKVVWRGNRYKIGKDSQLSLCPDTGILLWKYRLLNALKTRFA